MENWQGGSGMDVAGQLPGVVGGAVGADGGGATVDVEDSGFLLVDGDDGVSLFFYGPGIVAAGHGVVGDLLEVASADQVVEGLRGLLLVQRVLRDYGADGEEILLEHGFAGAPDGLVVGRERDRNQDQDDADDDHQLDQGEAAALFLFVTRSCHLPVLVLGAVERRVLRLGVDIENVLLAPGFGVRFILHGAHSPLGGVGHGINRNLAQKL
jgi:hypothetical protein